MPNDLTDAPVPSQLSMTLSSMAGVAALCELLEQSGLITREAFDALQKQRCRELTRHVSQEVRRQMAVPPA